MVVRNHQAIGIQAAAMVVAPVDELLAQLLRQARRGATASPAARSGYAAAFAESGGVFRLGQLCRASSALLMVLGRAWARSGVQHRLK